MELAAVQLDNSAGIELAEIWLAGFARLTTQERRLLKVLASRCQRMTVAFCLDSGQLQPAWHSHWFAVEQRVSELRDELESIAGAVIEFNKLSRVGSSAQSKTRFENPELTHLEA